MSLKADTPTNLPEAGGVVNAKLTVTAPADKPYSSQIWATAVLPGTSNGTTIFGPEAVNVAACQTLEKPITYDIPSDAAAGIYGLFAFAGPSSETPVEMGTVTVWKTGGVATPGLGGMSSSFGRR